ncbi:MbtH family protein [Methylobacterium sp. J-068]|uniref:MbtH family protein n=1 Tax=Methylobacterium sp. J-068 TaxID=2836649 RepID=UPI001FB92DF8|nr:MbtH family NRPS accessory protein [Methylobacterium sp. J-068]MCJ2036200.1 MbtH family NRPS accessory protein [Methylobacterium sp. J-068]
MAFDREDTRFYVVVNEEEQYSIWPSYRPVPAGWSPLGEPRPKAECLARIDELWTDMRPLSLRRQMEAQARGEASATQS